MARILLLYFGFWTFTLCYVTSAKGQSCLFKQYESQAEHMCITLKCTKKHVLTDVHLFSGIAKKEKATYTKTDLKCMGETARFIDQSESCFWRRKCSIQFPTGPMITSRKGNPVSLPNLKDYYETGNETDCIKERPNFACLIKAKCIKEKNIIDMVIQDTVIKTKMGIIRSHRHYPRDYDNNRFDEISGHKLIIEKPQKLQVGFHDLDIHEEDYIRMATNKRTIKFNGMMNHTVDVVTFDSSDSYVNITYHKAVEAANPLRGFIICFKEEGKRGKEGKRKQKKKRGKRHRKQGAGKERHPCNAVMKKAKHIQTIDPYSQACLKGLKERNCCCDVKKETRCKSALNLAKCMQCLTADPECNCDDLSFE